MMIDVKCCPEFKTDRLVLRKPQIDDSELLFFIRNEKSSAEAMGIFPDVEQKDTMKFISKILLGIDNKKWHYWLIVRENKIIGSISLWNLDKELCSAEFGFQIGEKYQREGYMSEAFKTVEEYAFDVLELKKIFIYTSDDNSKAKRFVEKMNYQFLETIDEKNGKDEIVKMIVYFKDKWS